MQKLTFQTFQFKVVAGAHNRILETGHQKRNIASMEANSNFNMQELKDDVSIITVTEPFDLTDPHVQPIDMFMAGMAVAFSIFLKMF